MSRGNNEVALCARFIVVCLGLMGTVTCTTDCNPRDESLEVNSDIAHLNLDCSKINVNSFFLSVQLNRTNMGQEDVNGNVIYVCLSESNGVNETGSSKVSSSDNGPNRHVTGPWTEPVDVNCTVFGCYDVLDSFNTSSYRFDSSGLSCCIVNNTEVPCLPSNVLPTTTLLPLGTVSLQDTKSSYMTTSQPVAYSSAIVPSSTRVESIYMTTTQSIPRRSNEVPSNTTTPSLHIAVTVLCSVFIFLVISISSSLVLLFVCVRTVDRLRTNKMLTKMRLGHGLYLHTTQVIEPEGMFDVTDEDLQFFKRIKYKEEDCISKFEPFDNKEDLVYLCHSESSTSVVYSEVTIKPVGSSLSDESFQAKEWEDTTSTCNSGHTPDDVEQAVQDEIEAAIATVRCITKEDPVSSYECNNEVDTRSGNEGVSLSPLPDPLTQQNTSSSSGYVLPPTNHNQTYPDLPSGDGLDLDFLSGPTLLFNKDDLIQHDSGYILTATEQTLPPEVITDNEEVDFLDYQPIDEESQSSCDYDVCPVSQDNNVTETDPDAQSIDCINRSSLASLGQLTPGDSTTVSYGYVRSEGVAADEFFTNDSQLQYKYAPPETSSEQFSQAMENNLLTSESFTSVLPHSGYVKNDCLLPCTASMNEDDSTDFMLDSTRDNLYTDENSYHTTKVYDTRNPDEDVSSRFGIEEQWDTTLCIDLDVQSDSEYEFINIGGLENKELHSNTGYIAMKP